MWQIMLSLLSIECPMVESPSSPTKNRTSPGALGSIIGSWMGAAMVTCVSWTRREPIRFEKIQVVVPVAFHQPNPSQLEIDKPLSCHTGTATSPAVQRRERSFQASLWPYLPPIRWCFTKKNTEKQVKTETSVPKLQKNYPDRFLLQTTFLNCLKRRHIPKIAVSRQSQHISPIIIGTFTSVALRHERQLLWLRSPFWWIGWS